MRRSRALRRDATLAGAAACLLLGAAAPAPAAGLSQPETREIAGILDKLTAGRDPVIGPAVAPARSLAALASGVVPVQAGNAPAVRRVVATNERIAEEMDRILAAFVAAPASQKPAATRAAVAGFDRETAADGASRQFEGEGPSLSIMRQLALLRADRIAGGNPVGRTMAVITSFERSPKTDDDYYAYSEPRDLRLSAVTELAGSRTSWTTGAQPAMEKGELYGLKKCRHIVILGWYCNTSLYAERDLSAGPGGAAVLLTSLYPLRPGADNPRFTDDRARNIVDGYTALYLVKQSAGLILVYSLGIQDKSDAPSQTGRLNAGHKEEYRQLVTRLKADLGAAAVVE